MSKAIYEENCFFHLLLPMQYKLKILPWILSSSGCLDNKHILFASLWFDIAHKNAKMCFLTDGLHVLLRFRWLGTRSGSKR